MKKFLIRTHVLFIFLLIISIQASVATNSKSQQEVSKETGIEKLKSLRKMSTATINTPEAFANAMILKEEALKQKNNQYTGHAYMHLCGYYQHIALKDSFIYMAQKAKEYYQRAGDIENEIGADAYIIDSYIQSGNMELALNKTLKLLQDTQDSNNKSGESLSYELLGRIYLFLEKPKQALEAFQKMLDLKRKYVPNYGKDGPTFFWELTTAAYNANNHELSLAYCDSIRYYANRYSEDKNNTLFILLADVNTAKSMIELGRLTEAKQMIENITIYYNENKAYIHDRFYHYTQIAYAEYYLKTKNYEQALQYIDKAIDYYSEISDNFNYNTVRDKKADILAAKGDYKNAFTLKNEVFLFVDSMAKDNSSRQVNELRTIYEVEKLKDQAEKHELEVQNTRTIIISLTTVCILLLAIVFAIKYNSNKLKKKNKKIFTQHKDLDKYLNEIHNLSSLIQDSNPEKLKEASLFEKTAAHLYKSESFRNPNLTRETLALELGTNRQYLTQTIQENKGMTFTEYINDFRLEYTRRLLSQDINLSIDKIYTLAGFSNKSTFYRLFKQKYDLTPNEVREMAKNDKTS
ncbi:AraC-like DNA-binding protein [Dysgonomonas alginatilytica]|uniref:AraC-like DNA-binding protein n=1 Tax=Dysgonomonas alginatilytica TaxID=1605892 RepID=A0A2V3PI74_9BACT|nr:helix-turn-helix domain-containing protein [Dysgonomonas alginatilytica]PXV59301.1 AraC-like DNA-binding protein [Dysgonomonas alginatilytica]